MKRCPPTWLLRFDWLPTPNGGSTSWRRKRGATKAFYLREIIERGIEDMEDYYLAADVVERLRQGREKVHSASDVRKALGLED